MSTETGWGTRSPSGHHRRRQAFNARHLIQNGVHGDMHLPWSLQQMSCSARRTDLGTRRLPTQMAHQNQDGTDANRLLIGKRCHQNLEAGPQWGDLPCGNEVRMGLLDWLQEASAAARRRRCRRVPGRSSSTPNRSSRKGGGSGARRGLTVRNGVLYQPERALSAAWRPALFDFGSAA